MKKQIQLALALFMIAFASSAQTPALFKYQSVVRDASGVIITDQNVSFEINILSGSANGNSIYTEEHHITTNAHGLANMTIGNGSITSGNSISDIDWGAQLYFLQISIDAGGGTNFAVIGTSQLLSVPYALHAKTVETDNVDDADADASNEIQDLNLTGNTLKITNNANASEIDLSSFQGNNTDEQKLSLQGNNLTISNGNNVDLTSLKDGFEANTDKQTLSIIGTDLSILGGNSIDLVGLKDGVNDADADATNEIQDLSLNGTRLTITNNDNASVIELTNIQDGTGTDDQTIDAFSLSETTLSLSLESDGEVNKTVDLSSLKDGFEANTDAQDLSLSNNALSLTNDATNVDLSGYLDNTDDQLANEVPINAISGLSSSDVQAALEEIQSDISLINVNDADADATNEIQDLSLIGSTLKITNNAAASEINLAPFSGTNTDQQTLSLTGNLLAITNGNNVDLASFKDGFEANTDTQSLSLTGTDLAITGGNTLDVSSLKDGFEANTDDQKIDALTLNGTSLSVSLESDGEAAKVVDLSSLKDGFEANTDDQKIDALTLSGTSLSVSLESDGEAAKVVDLSSLKDGFEANTDDQKIDGLTLNGTSLSVSLESDGEAAKVVDLSSLKDGFEANTDTQALSIAGENISISNGNTIALPAVGGDVTGSLTANTVAKIQGRTVSSNVPSNGQILKWDNGSSQWVPSDDALGAAGSVDGVVSSIGISGTSTKTITLSRSESLGQLTVDFTDEVNDADANATNEIQDLSISGNTISLSNDATTVDLSSFKDNTDAQNLSINGTNLSISGGNTLDVSSLKDGFQANTDAQDLSLSGNNLSLTNDATNVDLSGYLDNTDAQALSLSGTDISITGGNTVDMSSLSSQTLPVQTISVNTTIDNTSQMIFINGIKELTLPATPDQGQVLHILGGHQNATINPNARNFKDGSNFIGSNTLTFLDMVGGSGTVTIIYSGNTWSFFSKSGGAAAGSDDQTIDAFSLSGTTLSLSLETDGEANKTVDLSNLQTQTLPTTTISTDVTVDNTSQYIYINGARELTLPANPTSGMVLYINAGNESATINANGKLFREDGLTLATPVTFTDLVGGKGTVIISYYGTWDVFSKSSQPDEKQMLSLTGSDLTISNGNTITLPAGGGGGTDDQTIDAFSLSGTTLSLSLESDGEANKTVNLSSLQDGTGTDDQTVDVLTLTGTTLNISLEGDGQVTKTVNLSSLQDGFQANTDAQNLNLAGNTLSLTNDGTTVDLSGYIDNTDTQGVDIFSLSGTTLSLSLDNDGEATKTVDLASLAGGSGGAFTTTTNVTSNSEGLYNSDDFVFGSPQLADDNNSQHDNRFFFDKSKGAFRAGNEASAAWDDANVGLYSTALGKGNTASGQQSFASGWVSVASATAATAMGRNAQASGAHSLAVGFGTVASGSSSIALGDVAIASGEYTTSIGRTTTASGNYSTALGNTTIASGEYSTALGRRTTSQPYNSIALGRYNEVTGTTNSWIATEPLFVLGNGNSDAFRSNALTILKNGNMGIGVSDPDAELEVNGQIKVTGGTPGVGKILTSDADGLASWVAPAGGGGTDDQTIDLLSLTGTTLSLSLEGDAEANKTLNLASLQDGFEANTDAQNLSLSGANLLISGGTGVSLLAFSEDDQTLSVSNSNLTIVGGNTISLAEVIDISDLSNGAGDATSVFLGNDAGNNDDGSNYNVGIGHLALRDATSAQYNVSLGYHALLNITNGIENIAIGREAMRARNTYSTANVAIGAYALQLGTLGNYNVALGQYSLQHNNGDYNVAIGTNAGGEVTTGDNNVHIGARADWKNRTGSNNTIIGAFAGGDSNGFNNKTGSVFIGSYAGNNESNDNKLYIENTASSEPLIGGDFSTDVLALNANVIVRDKLVLNDLLRIAPRASAPASGTLGDIYLDTDGKLYMYSGGIWKALAFE